MIMNNWFYTDDTPVPVSVKRILGQVVYTITYSEESGSGWYYSSAELPRATWNRTAIISTLIRMRYSADEVEAITCNVLSDPTDEHVAEYRALQEWRKKAKSYATELMAWADEHGIGYDDGTSEESHEATDTELVPSGIEMMLQAVTLAKSQAQELDDEKAAEVPALFPAWADFIGKEVEAGKRLFYAGRLWKVLQAHTIQAEWTPDVVPALFTEIVVQGEGEPEIGTLDNPIPYNGNMELEEGKYYSQDGVVYLCIRSTGTPVYHPLSALVGLYVEIVN